MPNTQTLTFFVLHHEDHVLLRILVRILKEFKRPKAQQWNLTESKYFSKVPAKLSCVHAGIPAVGIGMPSAQGRRKDQKAQQNKNYTREEV